MSSVVARMTASLGVGGSGANAGATDAADASVSPYLTFVTNPAPPSSGILLRPDAITEPASPTSPTRLTSFADTPPVRRAGVSQGKSRERKIRFAPPPAALRRSYSTGRNIWVERGEDGTYDNVVMRENRDDSEDVMDQLAKFSFSDDHPTADADAMHATYDDGELTDSDVSVDIIEPPRRSSKLLGFFGRKNAKPPSVTSSRASSVERLSRTTSAESSHSTANSTHSAVYSRSVPSSYKSTGVPFRKTSSWQVGEGKGASSSHARRSSDLSAVRKRPKYPGVAQKSRTPAKSPPTKLEVNESFNEWGSSGHGGTGEDDDEDGSGLAWIRRRREERERERERRASAAVAIAEGGDDKKAGEESSADSSNASQHPTPPINSAPSDDIATPTNLSTPHLDRAPSIIKVARTGSTASTKGTAQTSISRIAPQTSFVNHTDSQASIRALPRRSDTLETLRRADSGSSTPRQRGLSPPRGISPRADVPTSAPIAIPARRGSPQPRGSPRAHSSPSPSDGSDSFDEDEGSDASDLDEDELAREEELAQQARTRTQGGIEKFRSHQHTEEVLDV